MKSNIKKICISALFAAIVFIATFVVQIPAPFGYVNLGDCFVLLCGAVLGPVWSFAAAGVGSALADMFFGFTIYAPATFLIKGVMALIIGFAVKGEKKCFTKAAVFGSVCEVLMALFYFVYECFILGYGVAAAAAIPMNLFQGAIGLILFIFIHGVILKNKPLKNFLNIQ